MVDFDVAQPSVAIAGSDERFPIHRVYCIGQNYAAHAREMGVNPERSAPVFFLKPADSVVPADGSTVPYPPRTANVHHEIELVVAIGKGGAQIEESEAQNHIFGYAVGLDLTRRDLQLAAKDKGMPWDVAKSFECAAPLSSIRRADDVHDVDNARIWLAVNDELRQDASTADLIWSVPEAIADLSTYFTLAPGDLIFTGTPAGVGPLNVGDAVTGGVNGVAEIAVKIS